MIARRVLAGLLVAMAVGQAVSFPTFVDALETYEFGPAGAMPALGVLLIAAEATAGVGLWKRRSAVAFGLLGLVVALGWTILAVQAFGRGLVVPNCGCFGRFLAQELRWTVLVQDAYFVLLTAFVLRALRRDANTPRSARGSSAAVRSARA